MPTLCFIYTFLCRFQDDNNDGLARCEMETEKLRPNAKDRQYNRHDFYVNDTTLISFYDLNQCSDQAKGFFVCVEEKDFRMFFTNRAFCPI